MALWRGSEATEPSADERRWEPALRRYVTFAEYAALSRRQDARVSLFNREVFHQEINQVVVGFDDPAGGDCDGHTDRVLERIQRDGTCFMTGTRWHDRSAIRISVSNWRTDETDVRRSVDAIVTAHTAAP